MEKKQFAIEIESDVGKYGKIHWWKKWWDLLIESFSNKMHYFLVPLIMTINCYYVKYLLKKLKQNHVVILIIDV